MLLVEVENYEYCLWKYELLNKIMLGEKLEGGRRIDPDNGLIMPWYTSPCLEWLLTLDFRRKKIFEYGVGDSTIWYRTKGAVVDGVDNSLTWINKVGSPTLRYEEYFPAYADWIDHCKELFDIIVIDGVWRDECTEKALPKLKPGGLLIIDNWKQKSADLEHWPLTEKLIEGMPITIYKEPDHEDWQTAVIIKP